MKRISIGFIVFIVMLFFSCRPKLVNFTKEEKGWFNVYEMNDTIIFQSLASNKKDTSVIVSKRIYHEYDPLRHDNIIHCVNVDYKNKQYNSAILFGYCKGDNFKTSINLSYLRSDFKFDNDKELNTEVLSKVNRSFNSVYILNYERLKFHPGTDDDPEYLFWDIKYGIIKYITFNGEIWERINF